MSSRLKQGQRKQRQRWLAFLAALSFSLTLWWGQGVTAQPSAIAQMQQAAQLYQAGQFSQAAEVWQQAANAFERQQDPLNQAAALSNLSLTYQQLSQWPAAEAAVTKSLQLLQATPPRSPSPPGSHLRDCRQVAASHRQIHSRPRKLAASHPLLPNLGRSRCRSTQHLAASPKPTRPRPLPQSLSNPAQPPRSLPPRLSTERRGTRRSQSA
ncbi:MAG: tetratricopeptide repeat protein [Chloroflexaceae bacterium]|nr:tetratricopeptide repeat protein [Chloroflexaceae bacterium]